MPSRTPTAAIVLEAALVMAAAAVFAFAANELSPHGLKLARDYFPKVAIAPLTPPKLAPATNTQPAVTREENSEEAEIDQRIKGKGLQPVDRGEMERLWHEPRYQEGLVVFVDARDEDHYAEGHIPGAYPLDRFHPEQDLAAALTPCLNADMVVVYCTGGDCEEAEYTALYLRDAGVPIQKLFVYGGGFNDWSANHLPLNQGSRDKSQAPGKIP